MQAKINLPDPSVIKEELINKYPAKVAKKRSKSIVINDPETIPEVQANVRTVPGIITQRGCSYAGCKGVV
ncbi:MAG: nitrogenase molybdenum-iron protein alpha chain, partial [Chlorobiales bacterium]|nr:nitrogenase molybdenum-iron protein alpha chain [Chlorobiales bacterium]